MECHPVQARRSGSQPLGIFCKSVGHSSSGSLVWGFRLVSVEVPLVLRAPLLALWNRKHMPQVEVYLLQKMKDQGAPLWAMSKRERFHKELVTSCNSRAQMLYSSGVAGIPRRN